MADKAHRLTDEKLEEMEKRLSAIYSRAEKEIQKTADEYFAKFAKQDEAKKKLVEAGKLTEGEYTKWRKGKVMYGKRFTEMKEQCAKQLLNVNQTALAYVNGQLPEVYAINYNALAGAVDGVGGYSFTLVDADTVRNLAVTDTSLLPYKELDPAKDIPWNMKKINAETLQGILQGESMDKIAQRMMNVQEMNKTQAIRSARTIVTGAENKGRQDSYARAEADGIILQKEWLSTNDGRTRHSHAMLDGAIVDQDKKFDNGLMYPGDPSGRPEEVYNCRCTIVAKVNGFKKAQVQKATESKYVESVPDLPTGYDRDKFSQAVYGFSEKYADAKIEHSANISKTGKIGKVKSGKVDSVYVAPQKQTIKIHNHPRGTVFSLEDIENQTFSVCDGIIATGKDGDYYFIKTGSFDGMKLANKIHNHREAFVQEIRYGDWEGWLERNQDRYGYRFAYVPKRGKRK